MTRTPIKNILGPVWALFFVFWVTGALAQNQERVDSLVSSLKNKTLPDSVRLWTLNELALEYRRSDPNHAMQYAREALKEAGNKGSLKERARSYSILSEVYRKKGQYSEALEFQLEAVKLRDKIHDMKGLGISYNSIGLIYWAQNNYNKALEYFTKSRETAESVGDKKGQANSLNNIGLILYEQNKYKDALSIFLQALKINEETGKIDLQANNLGNIGNVYKDLKDYSRALDYYQKANKCFEQMGDESSMALIEMEIGTILEQKGDLAGAIEKFDHVLRIAVEMEDYEQQKYAYEALSNVYSRMNNFEKALGYFKLFSAVKDTLYNGESAKAMAEMGTKYESEKKQQEIELLNKDKALKDSQIKQQNTQRNFLMGVVALILVLAFVLLRSNRAQRRANKLLAEQKAQIEEQKNVVEHQKQEITDSINYAKRIQQAILPPFEDIARALPESFVLYRPKDIVSGDFFWFFEAPAATGSPVLIAAADCTGHGVPGAFMSMIGTDKLNEAVKETLVPGEILRYLNRSVKRSLRQSGADGETRDGMDIALCTVHPGSGKIEYAGANRPLWIIRKGSEQVEEIKATKTAIGGLTAETQEFETHRIALEKGDTVYIFSDGFADQFGGNDGKKLMTRSLKNRLLELRTLPLNEQQSRLTAYFDEWKGGYEQVDDVLVIGIRL